MILEHFSYYDFRYRISWNIIVNNFAEFIISFANEFINDNTNHIISFWFGKINDKVDEDIDSLLY